MRNEIRPTAFGVRVYTTAMEAQVLPATRQRGKPTKTSDPREIARCGASRARHRVVRFVVANKLIRFITLTTAEPATREQVVSAVSGAVQGLRRRLGPFPWLSVPEDEPRPHAHLFVPDHVGSPLLSCWDHGYSDNRRLDTLDDLRAAALYATKTFGGSATGQRRYHSAHGYAPPSEIHEVDSLTDLAPIAESLGGSLPEPGTLHQPKGFYLPTVRFVEPHLAPPPTCPTPDMSQDND